MNAQMELVNLLAHSKFTLLCADIKYEHSAFGTGEPKVIKLCKDYTSDNLTKFLDYLNFDYDDGYGGQELFGTLWFTNGTWASREEYDGSEWWRVHICPDIPLSCISEEGVVYVEGTDEEPTELDYWDGDDSQQG